MIQTSRLLPALRPAGRPWFVWLVMLCSGVVGAAAASAADALPPAPENHFNDYAALVPRETALRLNRELAEFERTTSNQILVAIYPRLPAGAEVADHAVRAAQAWRVGQKDRRNGAVLFIFKESRDLWIATGYGLEGALPDARCKQIIEEEIVPRFRAGDFGGGVTAGVQAMMAAARGEYRGSGRTVRDAARPSAGSGNGGSMIVVLVVMLIIFGLGRANGRRGTVYGRRGRRTMWMGPPWGGWGGGGWGGGGGGGWSGGSGGTFSGGGGSFGGGGAGGKW